MYSGSRGGGTIPQSRTKVVGVLRGTLNATGAPQVLFSPMRPSSSVLVFLATLGCVPVALAQAVPGVTGGTGRDLSQLPGSFQTLHNDFNTVDKSGDRILTRSGCLAQFGDTFYWYGGNPRGFREQHCYASKDLVHWAHKGVVLRHDTDANRIDVLYNDTTKQYVMFLKYDGNGAHFAVATADNPEGPFMIKKVMLIDNALIGDMSMFKDDDGSAYLCYVSWAKGTNRQHGIYKMSADYLTPEERVHLWDLGGREAPHLFKRNGTYYYGTSETAWIDSSGTHYYTATNLAGPWTSARAMPTPGSDNSWDSQCDFVFPIKGEQGTVYVYVGDRWLRDAPRGRNGSYVWLPMEFDGDMPVLRYHQDWEINLREGTWRAFDAARNLAAGKSVIASSEANGNVATNVTSATNYTNYVAKHWDSDASDPQWLSVDLGVATQVGRVILKWNVAAAKTYQIQTSVDGSTWSDAFATDRGSANVVADVQFSQRTARYIRVNGIERAPVQVETRRRVPGDPAAATRPASNPTSRPSPPMRYSLFNVTVLAK